MHFDKAADYFDSAEKTTKTVIRNKVTRMMWFYLFLAAEAGEI